ncbi:hypothetical protein Salat_1158300 [Sesamum alatum]|uniref:CCHC-type domain-containing protein n=1 Tax=Sesamum alatum TaxID=300844 RepID=A0AAE2CNE8_9LAMI|nr:hypothetical protein Salat_1158300 [Sesamum alatum]
MPEPIERENGQTAQYYRELNAYDKWRDQDLSACFTVLSCMHDNLIREYEKYPTTKELWKVLKATYGGTLATRLRALTLRFNQYILDPKHSIFQHLDLMKDAALVAHAGQRKPHKGKRWNKPTGARQSQGQSQSQNLAPQGDKVMKRRQGKWGGKKNVAKAKCYNCQKIGHFARDYTEPKKIQAQQNM